MPCPRGDEWLREELSGWRRAGLNSVVSLLEDREVCDLGLTHESHLCRSFGLHLGCVLAGLAGLVVLALPIARREARPKGTAKTGDY